VPGRNGNAQDVTKEETGANTETEKQFLYNTYRAHNRNADEEPPPTEQETARARVAYELLSSWHIVPGSTPEHAIDSAALNAWVDDA